MTMHHEEAVLPLLDTYEPPGADLDRVGRLALVVGGAAALLTAALGIANPVQFFRSYLVAFVWVSGITFGCFGLMALHHLSSGAWGLMIRRVFEAATRTIPLLAVAFVPVVLGMRSLYPWTHPDAHLEGFSAVYLTPSGFVARAAIAFVLWSAFTGLLSKMSLQQDQTGDRTLRRRMQFVSSGALCVHVIVMTLCSVDWLMSLSAGWASTIYGFYVIAGQVVSALAFVIIVALFLACRPPLEGRFRPDHFHDYGKLLLAFTMIWAYFSVSQFIIIWSGNLPDETTWYMARVSGGWRFFSVFLVFGSFVLPFVLLLSRNLKRDKTRLARVAVLTLVMRWFDDYWLAVPAFSEHVAPHLLDITAPVALFGLWFFLFTRQLKTRSLLPSREPALKEALGHA
jgi:hypothetical protein